MVRDLRYKLDGVGFFDERRVHIFVCDVESGKETQLTRGDYYDDQPAWSPNGRAIAFVSDRERERNQREWRTDVWAVPATGGPARKLTRSRGSAAHPTYSPDGRWIAFVGHENGDEGVSKNTHMMIVPARGGAPKPVSAATDRPVVGWPAFPSGRSFNWSADSKSLLFLAADRGTQAIYKANLSGKAAKVFDGARQRSRRLLSRLAKRAVGALRGVARQRQEGDEPQPRQRRSGEPGTARKRAPPLV